MTIEYRAVGGSATASEGVLTGLVTPFNVWTDIGDPKRGGFREQIAPGAFKKTLQERDVVLINNHNTGQPMARTSIKDGPGSLALTEDPASGLRMSAQPVDTSYAQDVLKSASAGVIAGMSFGFESVKDDWLDDAGNRSDSMRGTQRIVREAKLPEVTTTAFPAYTTTQLSARDTIAAARESRAAKATYSDLHTCAECGASGQYGSFCGDCGKPMGDGESSNDFCTSCGSKMSGKRSEHVCETRSESVGDGLLDAAANLLTVYNRLPADLRDQLGDEFRAAVDGLARRDEVDGDADGDELLRVQALGAVCDLLGIDSGDLPPGVVTAIHAVAAYKKEIAETVSATGGHGDVTEGARDALTGAGATTPEGDSEALKSEARARAALFGIALA